jgi:hypothetical protein
MLVYFQSHAAPEYYRNEEALKAYERIYGVPKRLELQSNAQCAENDDPVWVKGGGTAANTEAGANQLKTDGKLFGHDEIVRDIPDHTGQMAFPTPFPGIISWVDSAKVTPQQITGPVFELNVRTIVREEIAKALAK